MENVNTAKDSLIGRIHKLEVDIVKLDIDIDCYKNFATHDDCSNCQRSTKGVLIDILSESQRHDAAEKLGRKRDTKQRQLAELRERLQRLDAGSAGKMKWNGTKRELADWILEAWKGGKISAASERNALDQAAAHFETQDSSELTGKSLQQNLSNRKNIEGK